MENIDKIIDNWKRLLDEGNTKEAEEIYSTKIFPEIKKKVSEDAKNDGLEGKYDGLLLTVGESPEPLILSITALKPKWVGFLYTEKSKNHLDRIVSDCNIRPSQVEQIEIGKSDASDVYNAIKEICENKRETEKIGVDITGGTKAMVGGATVASALLDFDILYVETKWLAKYRKPEPLSERIILLENPYKVFGDLKEKVGIELFNSHDYAGAMNIFGKLLGSARNPLQFEVEMKLSVAYDCWDRYDYEEGKKKLDEVLNKIKQYALPINNEKRKKLEKQLELLEKLKKSNQGDLFTLLKDNEFAINFIIDIYCSAMRKYEQGKYDEGIVRLYRVLELISQYRLALKGINTEKVDRSKLSNNVVSEFKECAKIIYGGEKEIPVKIGLMDGYILLFCLKDDIWSSLCAIADVKKFQNAANPRNHLAIIHGKNIGTKKAFEEFEKTTREWLERIIERTTIERIIKEYEHIKLPFV